MKKFWIFLVSVLMVAVSVFSVVGCNSEKVLANYLLPESGKLLEEDFTLPSSINDHEVTWTSSNTDSIVIEQGEGQYDAKVTLGDKVEEVALTVSCGKEKKSFDVTVRALDVSYFVENFKFAQDKATVYEDFELPTATEEINGKKATITWAVDDKGGVTSDYLNIVTENGKTTCKVTQSTVQRDLKLYATFSYNGQTQKPNYKVTVSYERTHEELVDYWYYNTGVSVEMSGYIVAVATAYSADYNNVNLYMVDDDYCTGYYLYRVKLANKSQGELLVPGAHVTVTGTINTNYNGLIETNAGGSLVVDTDKSITKEKLYENVYALDNDVLAGSREAVYHTSTLVSLTNWKVKEMASKAPAADATSTLFTLEKNGVKVTVAISKYMEGVYLTKTDNDTYNALAALYTTVKAGDVISVKGILGNYNGYQLMPLSAGDVTVVTDEAEIAKADEVPGHSVISKAIDKVQEVLKENGFSSTSLNSSNYYVKSSGYTVVANKQFQAPTSVEGAENVTIKYELLHASSSVAGTVYSDADAKKYNAYGEIENGLIKVTVGDEDMAYVRVAYTYTNGDDTYTTYTYHSVYTKSMTDAQVVANVQFAFELDKTETAVDDIVLANTYAQYPGSAIAWEIDGEVSGVTLVTAEKDGVTTYTLRVTEPDTTADRTVTLKATFSYGEASSTKKYEIKVLKVTPIEEGTYKYAFTNATKTLYLTGEMSGYYGATSENELEGADVVVAKVEDGYTLKAGDKYIGIVKTETGYYNFVLQEEPVVLEYNYTYQAFVKNFGDVTYFIGGNGTYATAGVYNMSLLATSTTHWVAHLKVSDKTDEAYVDYALSQVEATLNIIEEGETALPTTKISGVTFTWTLAEETTVATLAEGKLTVAELPAADTPVTLTLTATRGTGDAAVTKTKTVTVTVKKAFAIPEDAVTVSLDYSAKGYANAYDLNEVKVDADDVASVTMEKGTNNNTPKYYTTGTAVRAYGGNTITVSAVEGYEIAKITITFSSGEGSNEITADVGTFETSVWSGHTQTIVLTIGGTSGHRRIKAIEIVYFAVED